MTTSVLTERIERLSLVKRELFELRRARVSTGRESGGIPRAVGGALTPSAAQRRFWFLDQLETEHREAYHVPVVLRLRGRTGPELVRRCLEEIVGRHEPLRTVFVDEGGEPRPVATDKGSVELEVEDAGGLNAGEVEVRVAEEIRRPFDLGRGPLFRARLLRVSDGEHVLVCVAHHIVFDLWSVGVLIKEFSAVHEAFSAGRASPLAALPVRYSDFAAWQNEQVRGGAWSRHLEYWRERLERRPPPVELATDRVRPPVQRVAGARRWLSAPASVAEGLRKLSRAQGATLFMTLMAGFKALLCRYTQQTDLVVGAPIAGRTRLETEGMVGLFVNTMAVRTDVSGDPTFVQLVGRVKQQMFKAYEHQDLSFDVLVDGLKVDRDPSRTPLFQVVFNFHNTPMPPAGSGGLAIELMEADTGTSRYDLTLTMREDGAGLAACFEYNTDLFESATVERMGRHFLELLRGAAAEPEKRVSQLPVMSEEERRVLTAASERSGVCVLDAWNNLAPVGVVGRRHIVESGAAGVTGEGTGKAGAALRATEELGRYASDGSIVSVGRVDQQVLLREYRVNLHAVEEALARHPAVSRCVVRMMGEESDRRVTAYLACKEPGRVTAQQLHDYAAARMPSYVVPTHWGVMDQVPTSAGGGVDWDALRWQHVEPILPETAEREPKNHVEADLLAAWKRLLGHERISATDNFFEVGGNSLLALRLFEEIEKQRKRRMTLGAFFENPTVAHLAELIYSGKADAPVPMLVSMREGGSGAPLFMVTQNDVMLLRLLANRLKMDRPVYGIQPPYFDGFREPGIRVEDMARVYIREILRVRPDGPYHLTGLCAGAVIAFEIAQQLRKMGKEVGLLMLMDSPCPGEPKVDRYVSRRVYFARRLRVHARIVTQMGPVQALRYLGEKARSLGGMPSQRRASGSPADPEGLRAQERLVERMHEVLARYRPQAYDGSIDMIMAGNSFLTEERDPRLGWCRYAKGGLRLHWTTGEHLGMILEPNVDLVAQRLCRSLRRLP